MGDTAGTRAMRAGKAGPAVTKDYGGGPPFIKPVAVVKESSYQPRLEGGLSRNHREKGARGWKKTGQGSLTLKEG